jgi:hypothetical protein
MMAMAMKLNARKDAAARTIQTQARNCAARRKAHALRMFERKSKESAASMLIILWWKRRFARRAYLRHTLAALTARRDGAASLIQSCYQNRKAKTQAELMRKERAKVATMQVTIMMQLCVRARQARNRIHALQAERRKLQEKSALLIQTTFRRHHATKKVGRVRTAFHATRRIQAHTRRFITHRAHAPEVVAAYRARTRPLIVRLRTVVGLRPATTNGGGHGRTDHKFSAASSPPPGGARDISGHPSDQTDQLTARVRPFVVVTAHDKIRSLTKDEAALTSTTPLGFRWPGSAHAQQQISKAQSNDRDSYQSDNHHHSVLGVSSSNRNLMSGDEGGDAGDDADASAMIARTMAERKSHLDDSDDDEEEFSNSNSAMPKSEDGINDSKSTVTAPKCGAQMAVALSAPLGVHSSVRGDFDEVTNHQLLILCKN